MPNVDIAVVIIDPSVWSKILAKHSPLTPEDVRTALVYGQVTEAAWDEDEVHGRRLVVRTTTYSGTEFVAYLLPANEDDPDEGTFVLKTAIPRLRT